MTAPLSRDQIMRGKNLDAASRSARSRKGAKASPWSRGPAVNTQRAREEFAKRARRGES